MFILKLEAYKPAAAVASGATNVTVGGAAAVITQKYIRVIERDSPGFKRF